MQEPVCVEVLFITVFLWASIWGLLDMVSERLGSEARRAAFYVALSIIASVLLFVTPGLNSCRVI